ncbi:MAG: helix-turn-helix transcriptional regulator [Clostridia bacterium]|nr:helix-turn-helix transcriptional regulator [Clostridia bacterium]
MSSNDLIKNNVSIAIKTSGMTLKKISNLSKINYSTIIKYANKTRIPKLKNLIKLVIALNIKMDDILDINVKMSIRNEKTKK